MSTMQEVVKRLDSRLIFYGITRQKMVVRSKELGLNEGKGYSYHNIRKVISFQRHYNEEIVQMAMDMLEAAIEAKREEAEALEARLDAILAKESELQHQNNQQLTT